ncbi:SDR family oxidoreductase UcpA [Olsenella uli]|uniref:SDR family oxidoreductase UcpA n=1 Tax=Olsenella uli TaxID=133926 RepID=UPI0028D591A9|nr:SDR family oxidoreductase UcpA [Olsenella uli]
MSKLDGKVALITGAAKGLGRGIAETYARHGARLCLLDADPSVEEVAKQLHVQRGTQAISIVASVTDKEQVRRAAKATREAFGSLDIACCNAGICRLAPFEDFPDEDLEASIDVNIRGVWNTCQSVIPYMLEAGRGSIVIASSVTGDIVADAGEAAYALTKAALVGLTRCLAVEYASRNIRVNCSQLGYARTPMVERMAVESNPDDPERAIGDIATGVPMGRLATPEEVGELFAFLGSDESSYITGERVVIDGGATLPETSSMGTS